VALDVIQKIVYATFEEQYQALYYQLKQCVPQTVNMYFDTKWHTIGRLVSGFEAGYSVIHEHDKQQT